MKDRVSNAPGRYSAALSAEDREKMEAGQPFSITLARNDEPTEPGTPYNKESVLPDDVAKVICPDIEDPTPADAFRQLAALSGATATKLSATQSELQKLSSSFSVSKDKAGSVRYDYNFLAGHKYKIVKNFAKYVTVRTKDAADNDVDTFTIGDSATDYIFIATGDAVAISLYFGAAGIVSVEDLSLRVPVVESEVARLQNEFSQVGEICTVESAEHGAFAYAYSFSAGREYKITSNAPTYVTVSTKKDGTVVDTFTLNNRYDTKTFVATGDADTLSLYFGNLEGTTKYGVTVECVSVCVPAVSERVASIERNGTVSDFAWVRGSIRTDKITYANGKEETYCGRNNDDETNHIRTGFIPVTGYGTTVISKAKQGEFLVFEYASNSELSCLRDEMPADMWCTKYTIQNDACKYIRIVAKRDGYDFTLSDGSVDEDEVKALGDTFRLEQTAFVHRSVGRYVSPVKEEFVYDGELEDWPGVRANANRLDKLYALWDGLCARCDGEDLPVGLVTRVDSDKNPLGKIDVKLFKRNGDDGGIAGDGSLVRDDNGEYIVLQTVEAQQIRHYRITPTPLMWSNSIARYCGEPLKILYISGIHSGEGCIAVDDFVMFKNLVENHEPRILWDNCVIDIIPVANPSGYINYLRVNNNRVNLNRNFPEGWTFTAYKDIKDSDGSVLVKGSEFGASTVSPENYDPTKDSIEYYVQEEESKILMNFVKGNPDAFLILNRHGTEDWGTANPKIGYSSSSFQSDIETAIASSMSTDSMLRRMKVTDEDGNQVAKYPQIEVVSPNNRMINVTHSKLFDVGTFDNWFHSIGHHGYLLEFCDRFASDAIDESKGIENDGLLKPTENHPTGKPDKTNHTVRRLSITAIANLLCDCVLNNRDILGNNNKLPDRIMEP